MSKRIIKQRDTTIQVFSHNHKSFDSMLKKFKKNVQKAGIIDEYKERQFYVKKSVKRRLRKKLMEYHAKSGNKKIK